MINRNYQCDLCRDPFNPNEEDVAFGLTWKFDGLHVIKTLKEIEHHICIKCFQAIRKADFSL